MATPKSAIKRKISMHEKMQQQPTIEKSLKEANEKYSIVEMSEEHFQDEGK